MNDLITSYRQHFNLKHAIFSRIEHRDAIVAIIYKVVQPNDIQHVLKICTRTSHYLCEVYFLKYFADILPVPRIIDIVEPTIGINGAILMEYLPGALLNTTDFSDAIAYEIGSLLGKIHLNKVTEYGDLTQPSNLSSDPSFYFTQKFEEGFSECSNHLPSVLLEKCRRYYDTYISLLESVDGPCITHRDFRPGNVIVNNGKVQGIIDWSSARASFAEEDFCSLEFEEWPISNSSRMSFLAGYTSIRPVPDYRNVMPLLRLSRAISTIGFTVKSKTWENKNASLYQRNRQFLEEIFRRRL